MRQASLSAPSTKLNFPFYLGVIHSNLFKEKYPQFISLYLFIKDYKKKNRMNPHFFAKKKVFLFPF